MADIYSLCKGAFEDHEIYVKQSGRMYHSQNHGHYCFYKVIYSMEADFPEGKLLDGRRYERYMEELTDPTVMSMLYLLCDN